MTDQKNAVQAPIKVVVNMPEKTKDLTEVQHGWLKMHAIKDYTFKCLEQAELSIQSLLNGIEKESKLDKVQEAIKKAKEQAATSKDQRLQFTRSIITKIVEPAMLYEERNTKLITVASAHELSLREKLQNDNEEANKILIEEESFKTHFVNEYFRIAAEYRNAMQICIQEAYAKALKDKMKVTLLKSYKQDVEKQVRSVKVGAPVKFNRVLLNASRAAELFKEIRAYDPEDNLIAAIESIDEKFAMYAQDLKNADKALALSEKTTKEAIQVEKEKLTVETASNELASKATIGSAKAKALVKKIWVVDWNDIDETEAINLWTLALKHWGDISQYFKVKTFKNLSLEKIADAFGKYITETQEKINGIKIKEVKK